MTENFDQNFEARFRRASLDMQHEADDLLVDVDARKYNRVKAKAEAKAKRKQIAGKVAGGGALLLVGAALAASASGRETIGDTVRSLLSSGKTEHIQPKPELITRYHPDGQADNPTLVEPQDMTAGQAQESRSGQTPDNIYSENQPN